MSAPGAGFRRRRRRLGPFEIVVEEKLEQPWRRAGERLVYGRRTLTVSYRSAWSVRLTRLRGEAPRWVL